jgi:hypothetical protein
MEELDDTLNRIYKGKNFIRKSKYGRVNGVVDSIFITECFIMDFDSENKIKFMVDHSPKGTKTMETPKLNGDDFYTAFRPEIKIRSTNGVIYDFEECFFIM